MQRTQLLAALVRGATLVGGLSAAFGPAFSYTLLRLAYGQRWSETQAPAVLASYSFYILLLAMNGILEVRETPLLTAAHAVGDKRAIHLMLVLKSCDCNSFGEKILHFTYSTTTSNLLAPLRLFPCRRFICCNRGFLPFCGNSNYLPYCSYLITS